MECRFKLDAERELYCVEHNSYEWKDGVCIWASGHDLGVSPIDADSDDIFFDLDWLYE